MYNSNHFVEGITSHLDTIKEYLEKFNKKWIE